MRRTIITAVLATMLISGTLAQTKRQQDIDLQAARRTETVDGNLNAAVVQYRAIAAKYPTDRAIVATALVHLAECYQKLGDKQATRIYQQLVRQYSDQREAVAVARARLAGTPAERTPNGPVLREVRSGEVLDPDGDVSPDGRYLSFVDWTTGNLAVHDLTTGVNRPLTNTGSLATRSPTNRAAEPTEFAESSAISRDGSLIAFGWGRSNGRYDLRIISLRGTGFPEPQRLVDSPDIGWIAPSDWSPDGKWLAVQFAAKDRSVHIAVVRLADGSRTTLKSTGRRGFDNVRVSPDGRHIAYSETVDAPEPSRVMVMRIDGSGEVAVVDHPSRNILMGWAPDGTALLFASDRSGSFGLWSHAVLDGRPVNSKALLLRADIGDPLPLGVTRSGALYYVKQTGSRYVEVAAIDLQQGRLLTSPTVVRTLIGLGGNPAWSPDGKYLAYRSCRRQCVIAIRSIEDGHVRELPPRLSTFQAMAWSADGRSLRVNGVDLKDRRGIHVVDAQTGEVSAATGALYPGQGANLTLDGTRLYVASGGAVVERDMASGADKVIFAERAPGNSVQGTVMASYDRRHIAFVETAAQASTLFLMPFGGGAARPLLTASHPTQILARGGGMAWTKDSRTLLVLKGTGDGQPGSSGSAKELWLVPVDGAPRKLDIDVDNWVGGFRLSPDGRQIAFVAGERKWEVWAIDNYLPATSAKR